MTLIEYIEKLKNNPAFMKNVTSWQVVPERKARYGEFPSDLDPRVKQTLHERGIDRPYIHQSRAIAAALSGQDFVVVTPTASGKTLCYNVPVLDSILKDESARALYLFPTKALSSDQVAELYSMIERIGAVIRRDLPGLTLSTEQNAKNWGSDDVSVMMNRVQAHGGQAAYMRAMADMAGAQHTVTFDFDEAVLGKSVAVFCAAAMVLMEEDA